jgi:hypothetical protein
MRGTSLSLTMEGDSTSRSQEKSSLVFGLDNTVALILKSEASLFLAQEELGLLLCVKKGTIP